MKEYEGLQHVQLCSSSSPARRKHYLPHHAVMLCSFHHCSFFYKHKITITADIVKLYCLIFVYRDNIDYQWNLWIRCTDQPRKEYNLLTVTHGTAWEPYLPTKCLKQLAIEEIYKFSCSIRSFYIAFYVADLFEKTINLQNEIIEMVRIGRISF